MIKKVGRDFSWYDMWLWSLLDEEEEEMVDDGGCCEMEIWPPIRISD